jgi:uncharacterized membrane protein YcgQ (UPF0703/DUF1980 family)
MRTGLLAGAALALVLGGCNPGIVDLNARPTRYYQETVTFRGRVSRVQALDGETLLEVADAREHRVFVRVAGKTDVRPDDWVKVTGILVAETRVGGRIVYDVVQAEDVSSARAPWFRNLF